MPLINILSVKIQPFFYIFYTELSSQFEPARLRPNPPAGPRRRVILPVGLQLMRPDGTFYDLVPPVHPITTEDEFHIGILEPNGILRPIFHNRIIVKVKRRGPGDFQIIPLTLQEFLWYPFNRDFTPYNVNAARFVEENRNRQRGNGSS